MIKMLFVFQNVCLFLLGDLVICSLQLNWFSIRYVLYPVMRLEPQALDLFMLQGQLCRDGANIPFCLYNYKRIQRNSNVLFIFIAQINTIAHQLQNFLSLIYLHCSGKYNCKLFRELSKDYQRKCTSTLAAKENLLYFNAQLSLTAKRGGRFSELTMSITLTQQSQNEM